MIIINHMELIYYTRTVWIIWVLVELEQTLATFTTPIRAKKSTCSWRPMLASSTAILIAGVKGLAPTALSVLLKDWARVLNGQLKLVTQRKPESLHIININYWNMILILYSNIYKSY